MWQALNALITAYLVNILKAFKAKARKEIIQEIFWPLALAQRDYVQSFGVLCAICVILVNVFLFSFEASKKKKGFQKTVSKKRFPKKRFPKKGFQKKVAKKRFPKKGLQKKVSNKRFLSGNSWCKSNFELNRAKTSTSKKRRKADTNYVLEWIGIKFYYYEPKMSAGMIKEHECM